MGMNAVIYSTGMDAAANLANILNDILKEMLRINKEKTKEALRQAAAEIAKRKIPFTGQFASCRVLAEKIQNEVLKNKIIELLDHEAEMRDMGKDASNSWKQNITKLINSADISRKEKNALISSFDTLHKINDTLQIPEMGQVEHFRSKISYIVDDPEAAKELIGHIDRVAKKGVNMTQGLDEISKVLAISKLSELEKGELYKFIGEAKSSINKLSTRLISAEVYNNMKWAIKNQLSDKVKVMAITDGRYMLAYPSMHDKLIFDLIRANTRSINSVDELKRTSKEVMIFDNVSPAVAFKALQINRTDGRIVKQPMAIEKKSDGKYKVYFKMDSENREERNRRYSMANNVIASAVYTIASGEKDTMKLSTEFKLREHDAILTAINNIHSESKELPYITGKYTEDKGKTFNPREGGVLIQFKQDFKAGTYTPGTMMMFDDKKALIKHEDKSTLTIRSNRGAEQYKRELMAKAQDMANDSIFIPKERYDKINDRAKSIINRAIVDSKNAHQSLPEYIKTRLNDIETILQETDKKDKNYGVYINEKTELLAVKDSMQRNSDGKLTVDTAKIFNRLIVNEYIQEHHFNQKMTKSDALETTVVAKVSKDYRDDPQKNINMQIATNTVYMENQNTVYIENCKDSPVKEMLDEMYHEQDKRLNASYKDTCKALTDKIAVKDKTLAADIRNKLDSIDYMELSPSVITSFKDQVTMSSSLDKPDKAEICAILSNMEENYGYDITSRRETALEEIQEMTARSDEVEINLTNNILNLSEYTNSLMQAQEKAGKRIERSLREENGNGRNRTSRKETLYERQDSTRHTERPGEIIEVI